MTADNKPSPEEMDKLYAEFVFDHMLDNEGQLEEFFAIKQIVNSTLEKSYNGKNISALNKEELIELRRTVVELWCQSRRENQID